MIPYSELCDALNRWRAKSGLPVAGAVPPAAIDPEPIPAHAGWDNQVSNVSADLDALDFVED